MITGKVLTGVDKDFGTLPPWSCPCIGPYGFMMEYLHASAAGPGTVEAAATGPGGIRPAAARSSTTSRQLSQMALPDDGYDLARAGWACRAATPCS
jgi:hypothetical protein